MCYEDGLDSCQPSIPLFNLLFETFYSSPWPILSTKYCPTSSLVELCIFVETFSRVYKTQDFSTYQLQTWGVYHPQHSRLPCQLLSIYCFYHRGQRCLVPSRYHFGADRVTFSCNSFVTDTVSRPSDTGGLGGGGYSPPPTFFQNTLTFLISN